MLMRWALPQDAAVTGITVNSTPTASYYKPTGPPLKVRKSAGTEAEVEAAVKTGKPGMDDIPSELICSVVEETVKAHNRSM